MPPSSSARTSAKRGRPGSTASSTLAAMKRELAALYSGIGRPSIAPQMLLRAMLLQAFYSLRSERHLMERMEFDLLFRWFVGLGAYEASWTIPVGC